MRLNLRGLGCRGEHQVAHAVPIIAIDALHVLGERARVHRDLGMIVRAEKIGALDTDGPIAEGGSFSGAGNETDVVRHDPSPLRPCDPSRYLNLARSSSVAFRSNPISLPTATN